MTKLELQTLNSGQISKIADVVGAMGEEILKFKKEFESRDRYYNTMLKGLDQIKGNGRCYYTGARKCR